jgi:hypothetical protein
MVNLMDQVHHIEESDLSPVQDQVGATVEQLRDLFFSRYTYQDDTEWLISVGGLIHEMCLTCDITFYELLFWIHMM